MGPAPLLPVPISAAGLMGEADFYPSLLGSPRTAHVVTGRCGRGFVSRVKEAAPRSCHEASNRKGGEGDIKPQGPSEQMVALPTVRALLC